MFDIICNIDKDNWVFGYIEKRGNFFQIRFVQNAHSKRPIIKYEYIFNALEKLETKTKEDLIYICKKVLEKEGLKGETNE